MKRCLALIIVFVMGCTLFSANSISADSVGEPHVFHAGEKAKASEINENFDAVYKRLIKIGSVINIDADNKRVGVGVTNPGSELDIKGTLRLSGATSGFVEFASAPNAGMVTYTLPASDGADGQALITNGEGILSWGSESGDNPSGVGGLTSINSVEASQADLGLVIGADVQPYDAGLSDISGLAVTDGNLIMGNGVNWVAVSGDAARTSLGLGNVENTKLSTWSGSTNITTLGTISSGKFSELSASGPFYDSDNEPGTSGQVLTSTGVGVSWDNYAAGGVWTPKMNGDIYRIYHKVGIGTSDPEKKIHIEGDGILVRPDDEWNSGDVANFFMGDFNNYIKTEYDAGVEFRTEGDFIFYNGNVGIGVTGPESELEIQGALRLTGMTSGYVEFLPAEEGEDTTYILPTSPGSDGQALITDGGGALSWGTIGADHLISANNLKEVNAEEARANLGLVIGADVQPYDADLSDISGLTVTDGNLIMGNGVNWVAMSGDAARTSLGLGNVEDIALSTWPGSTNITTLGTISSGKFSELSASGPFYDSDNEPGTSGQVLTSTGDGVSWDNYAGGVWTPKMNSDIYRLDGNVGIGVSSPVEKLSVGGIIESTTGGFRFPDDTIQTTAWIENPDGMKKLIKNFVVTAGESVTAGDVVSYMNGYIQKGFGPGNNIAYGSGAEFRSGYASGISAIALSANKFVVIYSSYENTEFVSYAVVGNVSGNTITFGLRKLIKAGGASYITAAALSSSKFVVAYRDQFYNNYGKAVIGVVSGNQITFGSERLFNRGLIQQTSVAALSSTRFVITYMDYETNNHGIGTAIIGDISGDSIWFKQKQELFQETNVSYISITTLSSSKIVATYRKGGYKATIYDVAGDIITQGPEYAIGGYTSYISVSALSSTKFALAYLEGRDPYYGAAVIGDVSGNTIAFGPEYVFNSGRALYISTAPLTETRFVVAFSDDGIGTTVIGDVSGDVITYGLKNVSNLSNSHEISAASLSSGQFVVANFDNSDGMAAIGSTPPDNKMVGIADEDGGSGETTPVIIGGVSDVHSGLTPGVVYYADASGDLTTERDYYTIGLAVSSTEIILASDKDNRDQFFGDMVFANEFRITEADEYEGLILKNHFDREIFNLSEEGALNIHGAAMKPGGGSWAVSTDERFMKNVANIDGRGALDKVCRLQGVAFEWINAEEHTRGSRAGIMAQELETVFPEWVQEVEPADGDRELLDEGEKAKAVSFPNDFNAYLIEAIKELRAENEAMRKKFHAENEALEKALMAKNEALEEEIRQLKASMGL